MSCLSHHRGRGGATTKPTEESESGAIPQRRAREPGCFTAASFWNPDYREWNGRMHVVDVTEKGVPCSMANSSGR